MLGIKAEGFAGQDLRNELLPDMVNLARLTNCSVEVRANDTIFIAYPQDSLASMQEAYDRLYPESRMVMSAMKIPFRREGGQDGNASVC